MSLSEKYSDGEVRSYGLATRRRFGGDLRGEPLLEDDLYRFLSTESGAYPAYPAHYGFTFYPGAPLSFTCSEISRALRSFARTDGRIREISRIRLSRDRVGTFCLRLRLASCYGEEEKVFYL